jgi:hypothetical protein
MALKAKSEEVNNIITKNTRPTPTEILRNITMISVLG